MKSFSLLIKPASADCNLRCEYCFYLKRCNLYPHTPQHHMPDSVLNRLVRSYMETDQPEYIFGWQGGEPTLLGLEFFEKAVSLQSSYGRSGAVVGNGLQTNGTLITDDMARLFAQYQFLLGVSLDGPESIHDHYRHNAAGAGSHALAMRGIEHLQKHDVAFNILTLVSRSNAAHGADIFNYFVDQGFMHHQYIPCVEPAAQGSGLAPFSIDGRAWGAFLCSVFDAWYPHHTRTVSVRLFDSILSSLVDNRRNACHMGRNCCQYLVVEHNGDVYPCDFFVEQNLRLGNIERDSWDALLRAPEYRGFGRKKQEWNEACDECAWLQFCGGDCLKDRLLSRDNRPRNLSALCSGWKQFYAHAMPAFEKMAAEIVAERAVGAASRKQPKSPGGPGRNDPCPCGSGKKFKKCCGE
jgi:uncharacterized protein